MCIRDRAQPGIPDSVSQAAVIADKSVVHGRMAISLSKIPGATDIFRTLDVTKVSSGQSLIGKSALTSTIAKGTSAVVTGGGKAVVAQPLPSAMVKPLVSIGKQSV